MKMLAISAQTIPLWVGRDGEEPPELCGSIPADITFTAEQVCTADRHLACYNRL